MQDVELVALIQRDPQSGWSEFIAQHTRLLITLIRRGGLSHHDEVMDVYVRVCERLSESGCARLAAFEPSRGTLAAWLSAVVRRAAVDWVRSRAGRRRHFGALERMTAFDRRVFELRYWDRYNEDGTRSMLASTLGRGVTQGEVDDAIARVERALTSRHRIELATAAARCQPAMAIETAAQHETRHVVDPRLDPERRLLAIEAAAFLRTKRARRVTISCSL
jgi:DNA-directed RNA polymerase specialized sigma24 family protein